MAIEDVTEIVPEVATITPFQKLVLSIGEIPTNYLDSMSYGEQVSWFCMFLQEKVLPVVNQHSEKILEIINYLNNLDLQDEVNNKLDEMAESGQLQEIIAEYLNANALWCFDNVAEMKEATNLINGSYAKTLGFYSKNDFGGSLYKIRTKTEYDIINEITKVEINDTLLAELVLSDIMNVNQFGAKGDGETDDSNSIQLAVNNCNYVLFPSNNYVAKDIQLNDNNIIDGLNHNIIMEDDTKLFTNNYNNANLQHNIIIKNFNIICDDVVGDDQKNNVIYLCGVNNCKVENINIQNSKSDGIYIGSYNFNKTNKNIEINNCNIVNSLRNNISVITGDVLIKNSYFEGGDVSSIDLEPNLETDNSNVTIKNCIIKDGFINGYAKDTISANVLIDINIENNTLDNSYLLLQHMNNVNVYNNEINNLNENSIILYENKKCTIKNNIINSVNNKTGIRNSACNYSIIDSNIINNSQYALEIINSSNCNIINNKCLNNANIGIWNRGTTSKNNYIGNTIINGTNALFSDTGTYEIISNNNISCDDTNMTRAIILGSTTTKDLIVNNIITGWSQYAIRDNGTDNVQDNNITA